MFKKFLHNLLEIINTIRYGPVEEYVLACGEDVYSQTLELRNIMLKESAARHAPWRVVVGEAFGFDENEPIDTRGKVLWIEIRSRRILHQGTYIMKPE